MANPFKLLNHLIPHRHHDKHGAGDTSTPGAVSNEITLDAVQTSANDASQTCSSAASDLFMGKDIQSTPRRAPKHFELHVNNNVDNSAILALPKDDRADKFQNAVKVKLGQPWDQLAAQIAACREDYVSGNGQEDPGFYRRRRFKRETEVNYGDPMTEKFYYQVKCCARTPLDDKSLKEFATIAEYYGFGVKNKALPVVEDIDIAVQEQERKNKEADAKIYGSSYETVYGGDPNYQVMGFRLEDGSYYRYRQTPEGQKTFRDKEGLWLCTDSKQPMSSEDFSTAPHTWMLYKQSDKNQDLYMPQRQLRFTVKLDKEHETLSQILEDGTVKEITRNGVYTHKLTPLGIQ